MTRDAEEGTLQDAVEGLVLHCVLGLDGAAMVVQWEAVRGPVLVVEWEESLVLIQGSECVLLSEEGGVLLILEGLVVIPALKSASIPVLVSDRKSALVFVLVFALKSV